MFLLFLFFGSSSSGPLQHCDTHVLENKVFKCVVPYLTSSSCASNTALCQHDFSTCPSCFAKFDNVFWEDPLVLLMLKF